MLIIIDAYNLLKQIIKSSIATTQERDQFINIIKRYAKATNNYIILVFDGGSDNYPTKTSKENIDIVYSGYKKSADQYIKEFISDSKDKNMILVSSDNKIVKSAQINHVVSFDSMAFYDLLLEQKNKSKETIIKTNEQLKKLTENTNPELDNLMKEASKFILYKKDDEAIDNLKKGNSTKNSKNDRKLLKILKKL